MPTTRQVRFYRYLIDIYRPPLPPPTPGQDASPLQKIASAIPAMFAPFRDRETATPAGRQGSLLARDLDRFNIPLATNVQDGDFIHITAAPETSPDLNRWWVVIGRPEHFAYRSNRTRLLAKATAPPAVSS